MPFLIFGSSRLIISLSLLLILFLRVDFFEVFLLTTNPKRLTFKLLNVHFKNKKSFLTHLPSFKTFSKSFFFLSLFCLGNNKEKVRSLKVEDLKTVLPIHFFILRNSYFTYTVNLFLFFLLLLKSTLFPPFPRVLFKNPCVLFLFLFLG